LPILVKKHNGATLNYPTYDKDLYALLRSLQTWEHYLVSKEFLIHSNHESLKYLRGQHKLNKRHAKWIEYLEQFPYWSNTRKENIMLWSMLSLGGITSFLNLEHKFLVLITWESCMNKIISFPPFLLFVKRRLKGVIMYPRVTCLKSTSCVCLRVPIGKSHEGGLMGHFGVDKTLNIFQEKFYWPHMKKVV